MICSKLVPNISIAELKASSERCFKSHMYIIFIEETNHNCNFKRNHRLLDTDLLRLVFCLLNY
jgi:hypothetical protein